MVRKINLAEQCIQDAKLTEQVGNSKGALEKFEAAESAALEDTPEPMRTTQLAYIRGEILRLKR